MHTFPEGTPNLWITVTEGFFPDLKKKLHLITTEDRRHGFCNIKTLNLLPNVLAAEHIAVTTGIFGMLLLVDPAGGAKLTVIFTGVAFLLEGILKLCVVVYTVKIRENENVVWEDEFREI